MPKDLPNGHLVEQAYGRDNRPRGHWVWDGAAGMAAGVVQSNLAQWCDRLFSLFCGFREDGKSGVVLLENHQERNETNLDVVGKEILGRMV